MTKRQFYAKALLVSLPIAKNLAIRHFLLVVGLDFSLPLLYCSLK